MEGASVASDNFLFSFEPALILPAGNEACILPKCVLNIDQCSKARNGLFHSKKLARGTSHIFAC